MSKLTAQLRPDHTGKMVTRWVREDAPSGSVSPLPAPKLATSPKSSPAKKRPLKLTPKQTTQPVSYGMEKSNVDRDEYGHHIRRSLSEELKTIPFNAHQVERGHGGWYRFSATEEQFYAVMSVARPMDAMNLLHRGIRTADDAYSFLSDNGVEHLAGDHSELMDELLRNRIEPQAAAPYIDDVLDKGGDPKGAADWIKLSSRRALLHATDEVRDDMISGAVTLKEMQSMGIKNLNARSLPAFAKYIKLSKADGNPNFTVDDISAVAKVHADEIYVAPSQFGPNRGSTLETVLSVARFHGAAAVFEIKNHVDASYHQRVSRGMIGESGSVDEKRLSDMTLFYSRLKKQLVFLKPEHDEAVRELFDQGITADAIGDYLTGAKRDSAETAVRLNAMRQGIVSAVSDGWL